MPSKFQNQLVGTIILVALGVIILPALLDGKKKYYEDEFSAIPLIPQLGKVEENTILPPVTEPLLMPPRKGVEDLMAHQDWHKNTLSLAQKPVFLSTPIGVKTSLSSTLKSASFQGSSQDQIPFGQAYIAQLGALKNAKRVDKIVALLGLSGYRVFTVPSIPVQGQITCIYVGPDVSQQKLQSSLSALNAISGLNGQVKPYKIR